MSQDFDKQQAALQLQREGFARDVNTLIETQAKMVAMIGHTLAAKYPGCGEFDLLEAEVYDALAKTIRNKVYYRLRKNIMRGVH